MSGLCDTCSNMYIEYGQMLCKYEGDNRIPGSFGIEPITECRMYDEERVSEYEKFGNTDHSGKSV